jgi:hypothetical protein
MASFSLSEALAQDARENPSKIVKKWMRLHYNHLPLRSPNAAIKKPLQSRTKLPAARAPLPIIAAETGMSAAGRRYPVIAAGAVFSRFTSSLFSACT